MIIWEIIAYAVLCGGVVSLGAAFICSLRITSYRTLNYFDVTPEDMRLAYTPFSIHGARGAELACWFIPAERSRGVIIASHGVADSKNGILPGLVPFVAAGYSLVLYDMRHHHESTGRECTLGFWETEDLLRLTDYVKATFARAQPICYWGFSLGAVVSLMAAARNHEVVAVVAQGPFVSVREVVAYYLRRFYRLPPWPMVPLALWFMRLRTGARAEDVDVRIAARTLKHTPVLLLGSPDDPQVPLAWLERIHDALGPTSKLMIGPYGHYDNTVMADETMGERSDLREATEFIEHITGKRSHGIATAEISR